MPHSIKTLPEVGIIRSQEDLFTGRLVSKIEKSYSELRTLSVCDVVMHNQAYS